MLIGRGSNPALGLVTGFHSDVDEWSIASLTPIPGVQQSVQARAFCEQGDFALAPFANFDHLAIAHADSHVICAHGLLRDGHALTVALDVQTLGHGRSNELEATLSVPALNWKHTFRFTSAAAVTQGLSLHHNPAAVIHEAFLALESSIEMGQANDELDAVRIGQRPAATR